MLNRRSGSAELLKSVPANSQWSLLTEDEYRDSLVKFKYAYLETLNKLIRFDKQRIFRFPVDTKLVIDYAMIVKNPMDFETMLNRNEENKYQDDMGVFDNDVKLIISNCKLYNSRDTIFYEAAVKLEEFYAKIRPILEKKVATICNLMNRKVLSTAKARQKLAASMSPGSVSTYSEMSPKYHVMSPLAHSAPMAGTSGMQQSQPMMQSGQMVANSARMTGAVPGSNYMHHHHHLQHHQMHQHQMQQLHRQQAHGKQSMMMGHGAMIPPIIANNSMIAPLIGNVNQMNTMNQISTMSANNMNINNIINLGNMPGQPTAGVLSKGSGKTGASKQTSRPINRSISRGSLRGSKNPAKVFRTAHMAHYQGASRDQSMESVETKSQDMTSMEEKAPTAAGRLKSGESLESASAAAVPAEQFEMPVKRRRRKTDVRRPATGPDMLNPVMNTIQIALSVSGLTNETFGKLMANFNGLPRLLNALDVAQHQLLVNPAARQTFGPQSIQRLRRIISNFEWKRSFEFPIATGKNTLYRKIQLLMSKYRRDTYKNSVEAFIGKENLEDINRIFPNLSATLNDLCIPYQILSNPVDFKF